MATCLAETCSSTLCTQTNFNILVCICWYYYCTCVLKFAYYSDNRESKPNTVKVNLSLCTSLSCMGNGGTAPFILSLSFRHICVVTFTPQSRFPTYPLNTRLGRLHSRYGSCGKEKILSIAGIETRLHYCLDQWYSTWGMRIPGGTRRHLRGYVK